MKEKKERILSVETSDALNFLLYVHNYAKQEKHHFPYLPNNPWKLQEQAFLQPLLKKIWNKTLTSTTYPPLPIYQQKENFQLLFLDNDSFESCMNTFYSWWKSMAGQMAMERFIGQDGYNTLYTLFRLTNKEQLTIHLLYENTILGDSAVNDQLVLTLRETFIQEELIKIVQERLSLID
ncbi:hypothetical protein SFC66_01465 [Terribacillus saccharophilus]|uniref:hypothetical protein n=1 Tax=Terribacillus saccharophilus TaxID=361277 RepID=UPI0039826543